MNIHRSIHFIIQCKKKRDVCFYLFSWLRWPRHFIDISKHDWEHHHLCLTIEIYLYTICWVFLTFISQSSFTRFDNHKLPLPSQHCYISPKCSPKCNSTYNNIKLLISPHYMNLTMQVRLYMVISLLPPPSPKPVITIATNILQELTLKCLTYTIWTRKSGLYGMRRKTIGHGFADGFIHKLTSCSIETQLHSQQKANGVHRKCLMAPTPFTYIPTYFSRFLFQTLDPSCSIEHERKRVSSYKSLTIIITPALGIGRVKYKQYCGYICMAIIHGCHI